MGRPAPRLQVRQGVGAIKGMDQPDDDQRHPDPVQRFDECGFIAARCASPNRSCTSPFAGARTR